MMASGRTYWLARCECGLEIRNELRELHARCKDQLADSDAPLASHPAYCTKSLRICYTAGVKLVAYLRVSTDDQADAYGLDAQRQAVKSWAAANGHRIVATFTDEGVSGTVEAVERPGLSSALALLRRPPRVDGLIVARLDRLARKMTIQEAVLSLVWRDSGEVVAADLGLVLRDDPEDPMRTAMRQMAGVFAELDRGALAKRMRDGRRAKAATGKKATGAYAFGYRGEGVGRERDAAPNPDEQLVITRIVELRSGGASYRNIVSTLDSEGLKPRRAQSWCPMAVRAVVLRETAAT